MLTTPRPMLASLALLAIAARLDAAPGDPVGDDFQVNTYTTGGQTDPVVAADGAGGFVVAWESGPAGNDLDSNIRARRFDATGAPVGAEFQVNTYTTGEQSFPTVIRHGSGFVVLWNSGGSGGTDQDNHSIQAQRYDATGPLGGEFQVNTYTTDNQSFPVAAPLDAGGFVAAWRSTGSAGTDTSEESIQGQLFDATATPVGGQFQVNAYTSTDQIYPAVAGLDDGGFVVVWDSGGGIGTDTSARSVQGQRYDATGTPQGGQFQVNTYTTEFQAFPGVARDGAGGFMVVWFSDFSAGTDTAGSSLQARHYDGGGIPGPEFQVNTYTTGNQFGYSLGSDGAGGLIIVWESTGSPGDDTSEDSVQGRRFAVNGDPLGDQFQLNTYTTDGQNFAGVAPDGAGGFVVVWRSEGDAITTTNEIRARRFEGTLLATTSSTTASSTTTTTVRPGESLAGLKLQLTGKPGRPEKSKLALAAKDSGLTLGRGNQSDDDPVANGGRLTIASAAGDFDATHDLSGSWKYVGKAGQNRGYKWKSRTAAVRSVVVKPGKLAIAGQGASLGVDLDDDPNPVLIQLAFGAHTYCLEFGGEDRRFKLNRLFRATRAAAPAACP